MGNDTSRQIFFKKSFFLFPPQKKKNTLKQTNKKISWKSKKSYMSPKIVETEIDLD